MKKNYIFMMLLCILHTTTCQAHIIKSAFLIIFGGYLGVRWTQADFDYNRTKELIRQDAEKTCDHTISGLDTTCGNQDICKQMISLIEACKANLKKETDTAHDQASLEQKPTHATKTAETELPRKDK